MSKNRRSLRNYLVSPDSQIRYGLLFLALSGSVHVVLTAVTVVAYGSLRATGEDAPLPMWIVVVFLLGAYLILQGFAFILGLIISHRIFGPLVPMMKFVEDMKNGDYSGRVILRSGDDQALQNFATALNELAETHQKKSG